MHRDTAYHRHLRRSHQQAVKQTQHLERRQNELRRRIAAGDPDTNLPDAAATIDHRVLNARAIEARLQAELDALDNAPA